MVGPLYNEFVQVDGEGSKGKDQRQRRGAENAEIRGGMLVRRLTNRNRGGLREWLSLQTGTGESACATEEH